MHGPKSPQVQSHALTMLITDAHTHLADNKLSLRKGVSMSHYQLNIVLASLRSVLPKICEPHRFTSTA